jgi:hypothetical protein
MAGGLATFSRTVENLTNSDTNAKIKLLLQPETDVLYLRAIARCERRRAWGMDIGKVLRVDLTSGKVSSEEVGEKVWRQGIVS